MYIFSKIYRIVHLTYLFLMIPAAVFASRRRRDQEFRQLLGQLLALQFPLNEEQCQTKLLLSQASVIVNVREQPHST